MRVGLTASVAALKAIAEPTRLRILALLAEGEMLSLQRRLDEMKREQAQIEAEAALHRQRLTLAQQALERLESLSRDQFISPAQVQTKKEEVIGLQAQAQARGPCAS